MSIVFQSKVGAVVRLEDPALQCTTQLFSITDDPAGTAITFDQERSIITRLTVSQQVNVQFLHSLGAMIYIYVFGDRIGQIGLSGLSFSCQCDGVDMVGAEQMLLWYKRVRASRRSKPVKLLIGKATLLEGFVVGFSEDVVDPSISLVQWNANLMALPEDDAPPAASSASSTSPGTPVPTVTITTPTPAQPPSPGNSGSVN